MDDLEWDEWMEMTDAQHEAIITREMTEHVRHLHAMPLAIRLAYERASILYNIMDARRFLRTPMKFRIEFLDQQQRERIKRNQVRLLKVRAWRATGVYPGNA